MRRQRHDGVRVREREARAVRRQAIEIRRPRRPAVRRQRVGAQRVDGDEQDVLIRGGLEGEPGGARSPDQPARDHDERQGGRGQPPRGGRAARRACLRGTRDSIEFGRLYDNEQVRIVLADEVSPDCCRLWDIQSGDKLDKDRFRRDLGGVLEAYQEVARRLGVLTETPRPRGSGPVLVASNPVNGKPN